MRLMEKLRLQQLQQGLIEDARRLLVEATEEYDRLAKLPTQERPLPKVAPRYRADIAPFANRRLAAEAEYYAAWLAEKTAARGPGAACDSGEAKICALLDELARRLRK